MKIWFCLLLSFSAVSCATLLEDYQTKFQRRDCESMNWLEFGKRAAMDGRRPLHDYAKRCEALGINVSWADIELGFKDGMQNYCTPENARAQGVAGNGEPNYEFCDSTTAGKMRSAHQEGLRQFCKPEAAYAFGGKGGIYKNQCPKNMADAYIKNYRSGRKVYLEYQVSQAEATIISLTQQIEEQKELRNNFTLQLANTPSVQIITKTKTLDPTTNTYKEESSVAEDPDIAEKRKKLQNQIEAINSNINSKLKSQADLRASSHNMRTELSQLSGKS